MRPNEEASASFLIEKHFFIYPNERVSRLLRVYVRGYTQFGHGRVTQIANE